MRVDLDPDTKAAVAVVPDRQLSLAIGREGQNARLAAKLTGWSVDIRSNIEADLKPGELPPATAESELERLELSTRTLNVLKKAGLATISQALEMS